MALIKHANAKELTRDAIVLDLGDLQRQGEVLIQSARNRAAEIIRQAEAERDRLLSGAAEKGHAEGFARGIEEGRARGQEEGRAAAAEAAAAQLQAIRDGWDAALAAFVADRERMLAQAREDVLRLALRIAEKVTKRKIATDSSVAVAQVESVLSLVSRSTDLLILINPDDRAAVEQALPALLTSLAAGGARGVELVDDHTLPRGSCIARMRGADPGSGGGGEIDASIDTQLDRIAEALLPARDASTSPDAAAEGPRQ